MSKQTQMYEQITSTIIEALEGAALGQWRQPWRCLGGAMRNGATGRPYSGINVLLLAIAAGRAGFTSSEWYTFRQAKALGAHVRKGERGTHVVFYRLLGVEDDAGEDTRLVPVLRHFTLFNREQCDDLPEAAPLDFQPLEQAERIVGGLGAAMRTAGAAFYRPEDDSIGMPPAAVFNSVEDYYATLFHELGHWTGHAARLARDMSGRFGDEAYAMEELVAELTSAFVCGSLSIVVDGELRHNAQYVDNWLRVLRGDRYAVFTAAREAQKAANLILGVDAARAHDSQSAAA